MRNYKPYMKVATGLWALDKEAGMTEITLLDALVEKLRELLMGYELKGKSGLLQEVKIIPQYLPQPSAASVKTDDEEEEIEPQGYTVTDIESLFPCVIVKIGEVINKEEGALDQMRINVQFIIGVYDDARDCQGYRDVFNIIEFIRQSLLTMPARVLDKRYRLEMPFTSDLVPEQEWPFYFGYINTIWETGRPMIPPNFGGRVNPYGR